MSRRITDFLTIFPIIASVVWWSGKDQLSLSGRIIFSSDTWIFKQKMHQHEQLPLCISLDKSVFCVVQFGTKIRLESCRISGSNKPHCFSLRPFCISTDTGSHNHQRGAAGFAWRLARGSPSSQTGLAVVFDLCLLSLSLLRSPLCSS